MSRGSKRVAAQSEEEREDERSPRRASGSQASNIKRQRRTTDKESSAEEDASEDASMSERDDDEAGDDEDGNEEEEDDELDENEEADASLGEEILREAVTERLHLVGVIEKVSMRNFMCHDHLEVSLGPKLNFIIGHNGSGKSAILTALTVALGAKAAHTSRGTSLKTFVKQGAEKATIQVTLKNQGSEAYLPEKYGEKIIIERTIRSDGSGVWKIKSERGNVVSTQRSDLNAICDYCNIQIDNPLNVLTQDASRQFLTTSDASDKYDFFLRGTQLSQLEMEYDAAKASINTITSILRRREDDIKALAEEAKSVQKRQKYLERVHQEQLNFDDVAAQYVWAQVKELEDQLAKEAVTFERLQKHLDRIKKEIEKCDEKISEANQSIKTLEQQLKDDEAQAQPISNELERIRTALRESASRRKATRDESMMINDQYQRAKAQLQDTKDRIATAEEDMASGGQKKRELLKQQRERALEECKEYEMEVREMTVRLSELDKESSELDRKSMRAEAERDRLRNQVFSLESLIDKFRRAKSNHLSAYGPNMPKLLELVRAERRWRGPVVGPIGAKVKIRDPKWAPVLESVIGNTLNAFCVTNHQDRALLLELRRKAQCEEVPILTGSDELFDYSAGEPDASILTILRVLDIDDEFVKRQLINSVSIERAALVERRADGDALMRQQPRNVRFAFSLDLFRLQYGEAGSSTQTLQPYRRPPRLSSDVEARLNEAIRQKGEMESVLQDVDKELHEIRRSKERIKQEELTTKRRSQEAQKLARQKDNEKEKFDEQLRENEPTNITALHQAQQELEEDTRKLQVKVAELFDRISREEEAEKPQRERLGELEQHQRQRHSERDKLIEEMTELAKARTEAVRHGEHYREKQERDEEKLRDQRRKLEEKKSECETNTAKAEKRYPTRMETDKTADEYQKELNEIRARIAAAARQDGEDLQSVQREVVKVLTNLHQAKEDFRSLKLARDLLHESLNVRLEKWRLFRSGIAMRANNLFSHYLSTRNYDGSLRFSHDKRRLTLRVVTDKSKDGKANKDTANLSGGEKSYSTICLLMALWEAIGCPMRCLDEFDVFMDAMNRRMSMNLIMDAAAYNTNTQYILITPQSISNIRTGPSVRIHRLADPERNQTTLV